MVLLAGALKGKQMAEVAKLGREQLDQLAEANAEALEKEIAALGLRQKGKDLDYRGFWRESEKVHEIFKKISPLKKGDRQRLWRVFSAVRAKVRSVQEKEREWKLFLQGKLDAQIGGLAEELDEILEKKTGEPEEVENLLYLVNCLKDACRGEFKSLPDTPDTAFILARMKDKTALDAEIRGKTLREIERAERFLKRTSKEKFTELKDSIQRLEADFGKISLPALKKMLRGINKEVMGPYLVKAQKLELKQIVEGMFKSFQKGAKKDESPAEKPAPGKRVLDKKGGTAEKADKITKLVDKIQAVDEKGKSKEIKVLLEELEESILGSQG